MRAPRLASVSVVALFLPLVACACSGAAPAPAVDAVDNAVRTPATVAEAAAVLNLESFPLAPGAPALPRRRLAQLSYNAPGDVKTVFAFQQQELKAKKWAELPGTLGNEASMSGTFSRDGFVVSAMVIPSGKEGEVTVMLMQHGNVNLAKLPVPPEAKPSFAGPVVAMFITEAAADATREACRKLLLADGWQPYGVAGDSLFLKRNAVQLTATISAAPAQGGKTMISYSGQLLSADLPAPAHAENLQYADTTTELSFDTKSTPAEVNDEYRKLLAPLGWEATLDKLVQIDGRDTVIFRNPAKEMLTLKMQPVDGKNRVSLTFQTAAEIVELDRQFQEFKKKQAEQKKSQDADKPNP